MPAPNNPNPKAKAPRGKPLGIPIWGWVAAAGAGLVIAYFVAKRSGGTTSPADTGTGSSNSNPLGSSGSSDSGGGVVAPPPLDTSAILDYLKGIGVIGSSSISSPSGPTDTGPTGTSSPTGTTNTTTPFVPSIDSSNPNAGFSTTTYVNSHGQVVTSPGGPVVDFETPVSQMGIETPVIIPTSPTSETPTSTNPNTNVLSHGAVTP